MARMELPVLEKFCFIFDLRTGCMVMGVVHSIITLVVALVLIFFAVDIKEAEARRDDSDNVYTVVYTIVVMIVVLLCFKFVLNLGLMFAVYKDKTVIMKKYCIFWIIFLVLFIIGFLKTIFHMSAAHVISQIIFIAESLYYIIVIRSYLISVNEDGVL